jgi:hypothetical protein
MELKLRTTRTLKITELQVSPEEKELLAQLSQDPRYEALLNVMERACIEIDAGMVNAPVNDPEGVLGAHCVAKAAWKMFTYIQRQVLNAYHTRETGELEQSAPTLEETLQSIM